MKVKTFNISELNEDLELKISFLEEKEKELSERKENI